VNLYSVVSVLAIITHRRDSGLSSIFRRRGGLGWTRGLGCQVPSKAQGKAIGGKSWEKSSVDGVLERMPKSFAYTASVLPLSGNFEICAKLEAALTVR